MKYLYFLFSILLFTISCNREDSRKKEAKIRWEKHKRHYVKIELHPQVSYYPYLHYSEIINIDDAIFLRGVYSLDKEVLLFNIKEKEIINSKTLSIEKLNKSNIDGFVTSLRSQSFNSKNIGFAVVSNSKVKSSSILEIDSINSFSRIKQITEQIINYAKEDSVLLYKKNNNVDDLENYLIKIKKIKTEQNIKLLTLSNYIYPNEESIFIIIDEYKLFPLGKVSKFHDLFAFRVNNTLYIKLRDVNYKEDIINVKLFSLHNGYIFREYVSLSTHK